MKRIDRLLPVGPRSVLFGVHCWFIHPWFVAWAWARLYGFPTDPRLWACFFLHDLGYLFQWCRDMDGAEGERHPEFAARLMTRLFDGPKPHLRPGCVWIRNEGTPWWTCGPWGQLCLFHSRFYAKRYGHEPSKLCMADKLVPSLEPWWLYLPRAWASGELFEYLSMAGGKDGGKYKGEPNSPEVQRLLDLHEATGRWRYWYMGMALFSKEYAIAHRDGGADTWTRREEQPS